MVQHEVLSCETEDLSGETLFHRIGPLMNKRSYPVKRCFTGLDLVFFTGCFVPRKQVFFFFLLMS